MKIISILPAYHFPNVLIIETECGHKHLRPASIVIVKEGDNLICWCELEKNKSK